MYKLLLSLRYLRTRFIAMASVVSVTLGVATLIVVNSVMSGFVHEMHTRLHGILSDLEIAAPLFATIDNPDQKINQASLLLGDDLEAITKIVRIPALIQFEFNGQPMTSQIMLIGIDDESFAQVSEFQPFLLNELTRQRGISFDLQESGYDESLGYCGWPYRRDKVEFYRQYYQSRAELLGEPVPQQYAAPSTNSAPHAVDMASGIAAEPADSKTVGPNQSASGNQDSSTNPAYNIDLIPKWDPNNPVDQSVAEQNSAAPTSELPPDHQDPLISIRRDVDYQFDAAKDQYTGCILGLAIANRKVLDPQTGETSDLYLLRPGDDVQVTLPTAGNTPTFITENLTVVDFYSSKMHEYDANFAFMPLSKLQEIRGMIDPLTGQGSVSAIQIKLKSDADLNESRNKVAAFFPPDRYNLVVQSWQDQQRPLLSAVNLELTILNILLFLIIAVAGFGILATFFMIVIEKTKDIGILKALVHQVMV